MTLPPSLLGARSTGPPARRKPSGFSLLELLTVTSVAAIIAAASISLSTAAWQRERLNAVAVSFSGWLEEISEQTERDLSACTVTVSTGNLAAGSAMAQVSPASCSTSPSFLLPNGGNITYAVNATSPASWSFTPRGAVDKSSDIQLRVGLPGVNQLRCVRISAFFGRIQVGRNEATGDTNVNCDNFTKF